MSNVVTHSPTTMTKKTTFEDELRGKDCHFSNIIDHSMVLPCFVLLQQPKNVWTERTYHFRKWWLNNNSMVCVTHLIISGIHRDSHCHHRPRWKLNYRIHTGARPSLSNWVGHLYLHLPGKWGSIVFNHFKWDDKDITKRTFWIC